MSETEFLEMLNDTLPPVVVMGISFGQGTILKECDPVAFKEALTVFNANNEQ